MISIDKLHREIDSLNNEKLGGLIEYATEVYSARPGVQKARAKERLIDDIEESLHYINVNLKTIEQAKKDDKTHLVPPMLEHEQIASQSEYRNVIDMINTDYDSLEANLESRLSELHNELRIPDTMIVEAQLKKKISIIENLIDNVKHYQLEVLDC